MLVFVTSLWVTEATPYFVTALLVPVLVVLMDIMESSDGGDKDRKKAAKTVLGHMVDHTTILIMGGYAISSAFSRRVGAQRGGAGRAYHHHLCVLESHCPNGLRVLVFLLPAGVPVYVCVCVCILCQSVSAPPGCFLPRFLLRRLRWC